MATSHFYPVTNITQLKKFTDVIDVRSPLEFRKDHLPNARNCPVLSDPERLEVGLLHKQSAFLARKHGSIYIAKRIARLIQEDFIHKSKNWKPLVYCWRGGLRSRALVIVLQQIGWKAHQLLGGYKSYRKSVIEELNDLPKALTFCVICGPTGSGKSKLLKKLADLEAQVLDLEKIAQHKGSVLGLLPNTIQPTQCAFDSSLAQELKQFKPSIPVFVESESRHIGQISLPDSLYRKMHQSCCCFLKTSIEARIQLLISDYDFLISDPDYLTQQLSCLISIKGHDTIKTWQTLVQHKQFETLAQTLLTTHYDKLYWRSLEKHYPHIQSAKNVVLSNLSDETIEKAALALIKEVKAQAPLSLSKLYC